MKKRIFIGGAWPYANNSLHIGHFAALLSGDVIARYHRMAGNDVIYVSGTDSHGTPITLRALKEKTEPVEIANKYHEEFVKNFNDYSFSYNLYTTTMTKEHKNGVQNLLKDIIENNFVYELKEEQDFCPSCNKFVADREIIGTCSKCGGVAKGDQCDKCYVTLIPKDIKDKKCVVCNTSTIMKENKNLYFKLSHFQKQIEDLVEKNKNKWRQNAVRETLGFLKQGLKDRAISRDLDWGVEIPVSGYENKRIYVWFEAVLGYLTAGERVAKEKGINFSDFIKNDDNLITYYSHGKDNILFHTIIFPALIMATARDIKLPDYIVSSDFLNMNNEKMSKSVGNLISLNELSEKYNTDSVRYYFIANGPEKKDVNFSIDEYIQIHNKFMVGVLGNFVNRNLAFVNKKFGGNIPNGEVNEKIITATKEIYKNAGELIEEGSLRAAIDAIMEYVGMGNKYYDEQQPWNQVKEEDQTAFNNTTYSCVYMMANIANLISPFMPKTSVKIKEFLGIKDSTITWQPVNIGKNLKINNLSILFERIDVQK